MKARKFVKTNEGAWEETMDSPITDDMKAGDFVFYPGMSQMNHARIRNGAIALKTRLGFWVEKADHV